MIEIYWIQRLAKLSTMFDILLVASVIIAIVALVGYVITSNFDEEIAEAFKKTINRFLPVFAIVVFASLLLPSKAEWIEIYGIGGTIDYLKTNDTAKQLPDKCIKALDKWVDDLTTEKKDSINN